MKREPAADKFIKPLISAHEFINGDKRWCVWLADSEPSEFRKLSEIMKRVEGVKKYRKNSKKAQTVDLASTPYLFGEIRQPKSDFVLYPHFIRLKIVNLSLWLFLARIIFPNNSCAMLPNATLYHFGTLQSSMHMAWMRQVCGRLEARYRYSNNIVYNNFPWPEQLTTTQKQRVEEAAQKVLDSRAIFPDSTLADLYDPNTMPKTLVDAHKALDAAVDACYRSKSFKTELERLEFLFDLYQKYINPITHASEKAVKTNAQIKSV